MATKTKAGHLELPDLEESIASELEMEPEAGETLEQFARRLVRAAGNCSDEEWAEIPKAAQEWVNENIERLNRKDPIALSTGVKAPDSSPAKPKKRTEDIHFDEEGEPLLADSDLVLRDKEETSMAVKAKKGKTSRTTSRTRATAPSKSKPQSKEQASPTPAGGPAPSTKSSRKARSTEASVEAPLPKDPATGKASTKAKATGKVSEPSAVILIREMVAKDPSITFDKVDAALRKRGIEPTLGTFRLQRRLVSMVRDGLNGSGKGNKADLSRVEQAVQIFCKDRTADPKTHKGLVSLKLSTGTYNVIRKGVEHIATLF